MNNTKRTERRYLERCLELARKGEGFVSPNPLVGCVIVKNGSLISEGYHRNFGGPHAEIEALRKAGSRAKGATLYVNLEPCSHHGKTPPCVESIIQAGVRRVVACSPDPNPIVRGRGFRRLRKAGIAVTTGTMRREAEQLNEKFFWYMNHRVPFVALKIAQTLDGRVADHRGTSKWITSAESRREAHRLRSRFDAVLVGCRTVVLDNPELTVRHVAGRNPLRVVVDPRLSIAPRAKIYHTIKAETLVFTSAAAMQRHPNVVKALSKKGVHILGLDATARFEPRLLLRILAALGVSSVLVEGGPETVSRFVGRRLANKLYAFMAPKVLGSGKPSFVLQANLPLARAIIVRDPSFTQYGDDILMEGALWFPRSR